MTAEARELYIFIVNEHDLYNRYKMIQHSLERKIYAGIYDSNKAPKAFISFVRDAAKLYCERFGGIYHQVFNAAARQETCKELAKNVYSDWEDENC